MRKQIIFSIFFMNVVCAEQEPLEIVKEQALSAWELLDSAGAIALRDRVLFERDFLCDAHLELYAALWSLTKNKKNSFTTSSLIELVELDEIFNALHTHQESFLHSIPALSSQCCSIRVYSSTRTLWEQLLRNLEAPVNSNTHICSSNGS